MSKVNGIVYTAIIAMIDSVRAELTPEGGTCPVSQEDKASWLKLEGPTGNKMYIAKQKTCRAIELSWDLEGDERVPLNNPNGKIACRLNLDLPDGASLQVLERLIRQLALPEGAEGAIPKIRDRKAPFTVSAPKAKAQPKAATPNASSPEDMDRRRDANLPALTKEELDARKADMQRRVAEAKAEKARLAAEEAASQAPAVEAEQPSA